MPQFELGRWAAGRVSFSGIVAGYQGQILFPGIESSGYRLTKTAIKTPGAADTRRKWFVWALWNRTLKRTMKSAWPNGPGTKPVSCLWVKANTEKCSFDVKKADKILDFLLRKKQIQLSPNHNIPSADELKNKKYCKWHNSNSHSTNECKVFR
jgi:hypothetical protein